MFRPSRPLTVALLWLAIVLLPVRAWAAAAMPLAMTAEPVMVMQGADAELPGVAPACHGQQDASDEGSAPQACSLCGVCHSLFVALPAIQTLLPALPQARPASANGPAVEAAAWAGPERPPRLQLA